MKRRISLLIAVVMAFTLIYTPAAFVYADDENGEAVDPSTQTTAEEPAEDPAADEDAEAAEVPEATEPDAEEAEEPVTVVEQPAVNEEGSLGATGDEQGIEVSVTTQTAVSITVTWDAVEGASSYMVYVGEQEKEMTVEGTQATISGLSSNTEYEVTVEAYNNNPDNPEIIASGTINAFTKPQVTSLKATKAFPNYVISWDNIEGISNYVLRYSTTKGSGNPITLGKNSYTLQKLTNGKTYYVQVRAYNENSGLYSDWVTYSFTAATTGFKSDAKGRMYYYKNGTMFKGEIWIGKLKYYFDSKSGIWRGGSKYMWNRCKKQKSKTSQMIVTSRKRHTVCVFKKIDGSWCCQLEYLCSTGKKGSKTPHGVFEVRSKKLKFGKGHTCWYATRFHKKYTAYFHSVLYKHNSKTKIKDGRLGKNVSNGCIRLALKNAKWIYDNVKVKSRVYIY